MAPTPQNAMNPTLAPSHCAVLPHLATGLVTVLVKSLTHDPPYAIRESPGVSLVTGHATHSGRRRSLGHVLDNSHAAEINCVEDFGIQQPPAIVDPTSEVGVDLLGAKIVATHLISYRDPPKCQANEYAGGDRCNEMAGDPRPDVAERLK